MSFPSLNLVAVTLENHRDRTWRPAGDFRFAAASALLPVLQAEAPKVAGSCPVVFRKAPDGAFDLVALAGVQAGRSMLVGPEGQWLGRYIPAILRTHPFWRVGVDDKEVLCVDESGSNVLPGPGGHPFFDASGAVDSSIRPYIDALEEMRRNQLVTRQATQVLADAGLLVPLRVQIDEAGTSLGLEKLGELHIVSTRLLQQLSNEAFVALRRHDALGLAYSHLVSMHQLEPMVQFHVQSLRRSAAAAPAGAGAATLN